MTPSTDDSPIDLRPFCAPVPSAWIDATQPWTEAGWRYASNGTIAIRVRTDEPDSEHVARLVDHISNLPEWAHCDVADQAPLPPIGVLLPVVCPHCRGERHGPIKCRRCRGGGSTDCPTCGAPRVCPVCDGEGEITSDRPCPKCRGDGVLSGTQAGLTSFDGAPGLGLRHKQRLLLETLPGLRWTLSESGRIACRFAGGQAIAALESIGLILDRPD